MKFRKALIALASALLVVLAVPTGSMGVAQMVGPTDPIVDAADWQFPEGAFQPSSLTFSTLYPRPNAETQTWAYHRRAPTGSDRVIPLGILGGCRPYHVTINDDAGQTITVNNDYWQTPGEPLALTISSVAVASGTIDITVEDQCGNTPLNPTWSFEGIDKDNTTYFVHVTAGAADGGTGTSTSPLNDLGDLFGPNTGTTTWQGRQAVLCGTLTLSGQSAGYGSNNSKLVVNANKPHVLVACGTGATLQGSAGNSEGANLNASAGSDFAIVGFNWINPRVDEVSGAGDPGLRNVFIHGSSSSFAKSLIFDNSFDCTSTADAEDEGSNPAAIFYSQGGAGEDGAIIGNTFDDCDHMTYVMVFDANRQLIESNTITGSTSTEGFFLKGGLSITNVGIYGNVSTGSGGPLVTVQAINSTGPWIRTGIDVMYNRHVSTSYCLRMIGALGGSPAVTPADFNVESRRNSWKCDHHIFQSSDEAVGEFVLEYDSLEHDGTQTSPYPGIDDDGAGVDFLPANNDIGTSGILDDTTGLQEGGPDCTHGAEICDDIASLIAPAANDEVFEQRYAA